MESCKGCKFFLPESDAHGLFRRFPATVVVAFYNGPQMAVFPPMLNEGWCGEFKAKETDQ